MDKDTITSRIERSRFGASGFSRLDHARGLRSLGGFLSLLPGQLSLSLVPGGLRLPQPGLQGMVHSLQGHHPFLHVPVGSPQGIHHNGLGDQFNVPPLRQVAPLGDIVLEEFQDVIGGVFQGLGLGWVELWSNPCRSCRSLFL